MSNSERLSGFMSFYGLVLKYLSSKFIKGNESSYSLRGSVNKIVVPFPRTNYMKIVLVNSDPLE